MTHKQVTQESAGATFGACEVCFNYGLLHDGKCLTCTPTAPFTPTRKHLAGNASSSRQLVNNENIMASARRARRLGKSMWDL